MRGYSDIQGRYANDTQTTPIAYALGGLTGLYGCGCFCAEPLVHGRLYRTPLAVKLLGRRKSFVPNPALNSHPIGVTVLRNSLFAYQEVWVMVHVGWLLSQQKRADSAPVQYFSRKYKVVPVVLYGAPVHAASGTRPILTVRGTSCWVANTEMPVLERSTTTLPKRKILLPGMLPICPTHYTPRPAWPIALR